MFANFKGGAEGEVELDREQVLLQVGVGVPRWGQF